MPQRFLILLLVPWLLLASGHKVAASDYDVTILSYRLDGASELYLSARADTLFALFETSPALPGQHGGLIDFGKLSQGTFDEGDALIAKTSIKIGPNPAGFEAMSLMFHPLADRLSLETPLDAMISIGVCNGPPAGTFVALQDLQSYVGYFTDVGELDQPLQIAFPGSHHAALRYRVLEFGPNGKTDDRIVQLQRGQVLSLSSVTNRTGNSIWFFIAALAFGCLSFMAVLRDQANKPNTIFAS